MKLNEDNIRELLSPSEFTVFRYIKDRCEANDGRLREPMTQIGENCGYSEATVSRAVSKLRKAGVIGIVSSTEKDKSNEIVYYGLPDPKEQVQEILTMIQNLNLNADRFDMILKEKDKEISTLQKEKEKLMEEIEQLKEHLRHARSFNKDKIISSQDLGDGTTAYIVETKK